MDMAVAMVIAMVMVMEDEKDIKKVVIAQMVDKGEEKQLARGTTNLKFVIMFAKNGHYASESCYNKDN